MKHTKSEKRELTRLAGTLAFFAIVLCPIMFIVFGCLMPMGAIILVPFFMGLIPISLILAFLIALLSLIKNRCKNKAEKKVKQKIEIGTIQTSETPLYMWVGVIVMGTFIFGYPIFCFGSFLFNLIKN